MNKFILVSKNGTETLIDKYPDGLIVEWLGENSTIKLYEPFIIKNSRFQVGSNDLIEIKEHSTIFDLYICLMAQNSYVKIGRNFITHKAAYILAQGGSNQSIKIGDSCLFSSDIRIYTSDGHSIFDKKKLKLLNQQGGNIVIGNHCWVGHGCCFIKKATIQNDTVVGAKSLVNKEFNKSNILIAGSPAKIIRKNIGWSIVHPEKFDKEVTNGNP